MLSVQNCELVGWSSIFRQFLPCLPFEQKHQCPFAFVLTNKIILIQKYIRKYFFKLAEKQIPLKPHGLLIQGSTASELVLLQFFPSLPLWNKLF